MVASFLLSTQVAVGLGAVPRVSFTPSGLVVPKTVNNFVSCEDLVIDCSACAYGIDFNRNYKAVKVDDVDQLRARKTFVQQMPWWSNDNCYVECSYFAVDMDNPNVFKQGTRCPSGATADSCRYSARKTKESDSYCSALGCIHTDDPSACGVNDPHLHLAHGGYTDFRGKHGSIFNLLSHTNLSVAARFRDAKYLDLNATRRVDGTYMTESYVTATSMTGKQIQISLEAGPIHANSAKVAVLDDKGAKEETTLDVAQAGKPWREGNIQVVVVGEPAPKPPPADPLAEVKEGMKLIVTQDNRWRITVQTFSYLDVSVGGKVKEMWRIDTTMLPLDANIESGAVAPHGLIGQSFDGDELSVDGKKDDYSTKEVVTSAQGEGAIEGVWSDYVIDSPFATDFKYSRYSVKAAKPRDVAKLTGLKKLRSKMKQQPIE